MLNDHRFEMGFLDALQNPSPEGGDYLSLLKGTEGDIVNMIKTGDYDQKEVKGYNDALLKINQCTQFVDDVVKKFTGMELPRHSEQEVHYKGHEKKPLQALSLYKYLFGKALYPESGVKNIDRETASVLANSGRLVVVTDGSHVSIMAPGERPMIYRSDQKNREKTKYKVGVSDTYSFFSIDPAEYRNFKESGQMRYDASDFMNFGTGVINKNLREMYRGDTDIPQFGTRPILPMNVDMEPMP